MRLLRCEAIVLKTYDVGEADRFCILYTREYGRLAARACGARKTKSRLGAALLPFHRVLVELRELRNGFLVTSAVRKGRTGDVCEDIRCFVQAAEGVELLLALVRDLEPTPELFDLTEEFLVLCSASSRRVFVAYLLRVLSLLGYLPESGNSAFVPPLTEDEGAFLLACTQASSPFHAGGVGLPTLASYDRLQAQCLALLREHVDVTLRAPPVGEEIHASLSH